MLPFGNQVELETLSGNAPGAGPCNSSYRHQARIEAGVWPCMATRMLVDWSCMAIPVHVRRGMGMAMYSHTYAVGIEQRGARQVVGHAWPHVYATGGLAMHSHPARVLVLVCGHA